MSRPPELMKRMLEEHDEDGQSVDTTGCEIGAGGFGKIPRRYGNFVDAETGIDELRNNFLIENEFIRVHGEVDAFEYSAAVSPVAGVVLGKSQSEGPVLDGG